MLCQDGVLRANHSFCMHVCIRVYLPPAPKCICVASFVWCCVLGSWLAAEEVCHCNTPPQGLMGTAVPCPAAYQQGSSF